MINIKELNAYLKKSHKKLICGLGNDPVLRKTCLDIVKNVYSLHNDNELEIIEELETVSYLISSLNTVSFFNKKKLFVIKDDNFIKKIQESKFKDELINILNDDIQNILIVYIDEKQVDKNILNNFILVDTKKPDKNTVIKYIQSLSKKANKEIDTIAINRFISTIGFFDYGSNLNMEDIKNNLDTFFDNHDKDLITSKDIVDFYKKTDNSNIYDAITELFDGDVSSAIIHLKMNEKHDKSSYALMIMGVINYYIRISLEIKMYEKLDKKSTDIMKAVNINSSYLYKKYYKVAKNYTNEDLSRLQSDIIRLDREFKTGIVSDVLNELYTRLIMYFSV